jgi:hypothetical protein
MSCTHNFEDYFGTGVDKCLNCGRTQRSRHLGVLTHLMGNDGELYPNPACSLYSTERESNVSISLYLASGEILENL